MIWTSHEKACETDSNFKVICNYLSYLTGWCSYQWPNLRSITAEASDLAGPETWRVVEHTGPSVGPLFASSCMYVCMYVICMYVWVNEWMSEWVNEWVSEWVSEWMNEWVNEWMNEWMNEFCHNYSKPHLKRIAWKGPPFMNLCRSCLNPSPKLQRGPRHLPMSLRLAPSCAGNL